MAKKSTTNENTETEQAVENTSYSTCGGVLKEARIKQGLSIGDICTQLRLSANQIEALEEDQFSKLPQPSIVRGFIRNYAKALQIDAAPILAVYQQLNPETIPQSLTVRETADSSVIGESKSGFSPVIFIALISLFALISGGYYYYTQHIKLANNDEAPLATNGTEESVDESTTVSMAEPVKQIVTEVPLTPSETPTTSPQESTEEKPADNPVENKPEETAVTQLKLDKKTPEVEPVELVKNETAEKSTTESAASAEDGVTKPGYAKLSVSTTGSTWINITNAYTGRQIFSEIIPANSNKVIDAKKPFKVIIGNAPRTTLSIDGESFDLSTKTRNKVAKFKIQ